MSAPATRSSKRNAKNKEKEQQKLPDYYFPPANTFEYSPATNDSSAMDLDPSEIDPGPSSVDNSTLQRDLSPDLTSALSNQEITITFSPGHPPAPNIDQSLTNGDDYTSPENPDDFTDLPPAKLLAINTNSEPLPMDVDHANPAPP